MRGLWKAMMLLFAAGGTAASSSVWAACPPLKPQDTSERMRKGPLPMPKSLAGVVRSEMDRLIVTTLAGTAVCIDSREMESTDDPTLSPDKRFLSFAWEGYEAYGHMLIDRSGKGQAEETGAKPVFSPSGRRLAAVETSESGFGALDGLNVWQVNAEGLMRISRQEDISFAAVWKIDRWVGEDCIELSAVDPDKADPDPREIESSPRTRYAARSAAGTWKLAKAPKGCAPR